MIDSSFVRCLKDVYIAGTHCNDGIVNDDDWNVALHVHENTLNVEIDSGAKCNILSLKALKELNVACKLKATACLSVVFMGKVSKP